VNKKLKNIEQLYSESFSNFRVEPSSGLWKNISTKLAWRNFFTFNPTTLNAWYIAGILAVSVAGALWITKPVTETNQNINEITVNNTIETSTITTIQENETEPKKVTMQKDSQKAEGRSMKQEANNQKPDSGIKKTATQHPALSAVVLTKADSSAIITTKADLSTVVLTNVETQKPDSTINDRATSTQEPVTSDQKTDSGINAQTTQHPAPSTQHPLPSALFELYPSNPILPTDPISFINLSKNAVRCQWFFGDSQTSTEFQPTHFYQKADNYKIKLKVWSESGNVDSLVICYNFTNSAYKIEFPNAFTPNSNGPTNGYYTPGIPNNDVFYPVYKNVVEYHLRIFNRRGELIFESNDINTGWDGYINDRLAAQDVYVWKARGRYSNGENFVKFGNVMLIKK